jgi:glutathionylspermidine synthase
MIDQGASRRRRDAAYRPVRWRFAAAAIVAPGSSRIRSGQNDRETDMRKVGGTERADWQARAEEAGFTFHSMHGEPYWDETSAYAFTLEEIETRLEDPSTELHAMVREAVARIACDEAQMARLGIPEAHRDFVAGSWEAGEAELYGRMDLVYDGDGPAKLLEYNADTPTSLYEAGHFQWDWLEGARRAGLIPEGADQLNRLQEALTERLAAICEPGAQLHFAAIAGVAEDYANVETMAYAARDAGLGAHYVDMDKIGLDPSGRLVDDEARIIGTLFKLYPWEDFLRDEAAEALSESGTRFLEPPWKALVSNKALLAVLWEMFEGHPNLLPTFLEAEAKGPAWDRAEAAGAFAQGRVRKPIFSREGAGVRIEGADGALVEASGNAAYDVHPTVLQAHAPLPEMDGFRPVMGTWIVGETCVALGIREDRSRITQDLSRFKPHYIED